jgi:hypothetical protein
MAEQRISWCPGNFLRQSRPHRGARWQGLADRVGIWVISDIRLERNALEAAVVPVRQHALQFDRIVARTGKDAWAVGNYVTSSLDGGPLALHWNGRSWRSTTVPFVKFGYLTGVFSASATNAWAVGGVNNSGGMLLYHWNGVSWHHAGVPAGLTAPSLGELTGVSGDAFGHLWIFDFGPQAGNRGAYLRYDGHRWSMVRGALVAGQTRVIVRGVATIPGTSAAWSVGLGSYPLSRRGHASSGTGGSRGVSRPLTPSLQILRLTVADGQQSSKFVHFDAPPAAMAVEYLVLASGPGHALLAGCAVRVGIGVSALVAAE